MCRVLAAQLFSLSASTPWQMGPQPRQAGTSEPWDASCVITTLMHAPCIRSLRMHTCMHAHTAAPTHAHTYTHTSTHLRTRSTHARALIHTHKHAPAHAHTRVFTHTSTHLPTSAHACTAAECTLYAHAHMHTHTHTHMHAQICMPFHCLLLLVQLLSARLGTAWFKPRCTRLLLTVNAECIARQSTSMCLCTLCSMT